MDPDQARRHRLARAAERAAGIERPTFAWDSTRLGADDVTHASVVAPDGQREYQLGSQRQGAAPSAALGGGLGDDAAASDLEDRGLLARCWVAYRCLQIRADGIMSLPPMPTRGRGEFKRPVTTGRLVDLLDRVNAHWDFPTLMAMTDWTVATSRRGAFWVLDAWDEDDKPTEIWWAAPDKMRVVPGSSVKGATGADRYISHFVYDDGSRQGLRLERRQVVWFRVPDPANEFGNLTPFVAMSESARLAMFALSANALIFQNGLTGAGIITPDDVGQALTPQQSTDIQQLLREVLKGRANYHKVLVLNKALRYQPMNFSPRDAQFAELLELTDRQICIAAGIPKPLVEPTDSTFANTDGARGILWTNTLIPLAIRYAATIREQLIAVHFPEEADGFEFDTSGVPELQESANAKAERDRARLEMLSTVAGHLAGGVVNYDGAVAMAHAFAGVTLDEARAMLPPPAAGVKSDKVMAVGSQQQATSIIVQMNAGLIQPPQAQAMLVNLFGVPPDVAHALTTPGVAGAAQPRPAAPLPLSPPSPPRLPPPARSVRVRRRVGEPVIVEGKAPRHLSEAELVALGALPAGDPWAYGGERHRAHVRKTEALEDEHRREVEAAILRMFDVQRDTLVRALEQLTPDELAGIVADAADADDAARAIVERILPRARFVGQSSGALLAALEPLAAAVARDTIEGLGVAAAAELAAAAAPDIGAALLIRGRVFAELTVDTTWKDVAKLIARSLAESGGDLAALYGDVRKVGSLAYAVSGRLADVGPTRAETIARTEVHGAAQNVGYVSATRAGARSKRWLTALDGLVRPDHAQLHGRVVPIDGMFEVAGARAPAPGMFGVAELDIACRCQAVYGMEA